MRSIYIYEKVAHAEVVEVELGMRGTIYRNVQSMKW